MSLAICCLKEWLASMLSASIYTLVSDTKGISMANIIFHSSHSKLIKSILYFLSISTNDAFVFST